MIKRSTYFFFVMIGAVACLFVACAKELQPEEFLKNVASDVSLNKKQEDEQFRLSCSFRPAGFLALAELQKSGGNAIPKENYAGELKKFDNALYFDFTVGLKSNKNIVAQNVSTQDEYARMLSELTYNLGRDFYLLTDDKDTIRAITYNFSNSYGTAPDARFLFVFPKNVLTKDVKNLAMIYEDKVFGINKNIRFDFNASDLTKKLPDIKFRKS